MSEPALKHPAWVASPLRTFAFGAGSNVVLVHGGRGSHTHWIRNIGTLAAHYRVHALDLPGFGAAPDVAREIDADSYLALVHEGVRIAIGKQSTAIIGFSFGGAVAADLCRRLGAQCTRLALIGPGGFGEAKGRELNLRAAPMASQSDPQYREVIRHNLLAMMLSNPASIDEATIDLQCENIARTRFNSLKVSLRNTLVDDIAALNCPLHVFWGANDRVAFPSPEARAEVCREARPDMGLSIIPAVGHWAQYEAADAVNALLLDFLRA